jgi:hypothetical protein
MSEYGTTAHILRARRQWPCQGLGLHHGGARCARVIDRGDRYVSLTIYPSHDLLGSDAPYRLPYCLPCGEHYGMVSVEQYDAARGGAE